MDAVKVPMAQRQHQLADWLETLVGDGKEFANFNELRLHIGISWNTLGRIREGGTPNLGTLRKIAEALPQVSLADLEAMALDNLPSPDENKRQLRLRQLMNVFARLPPDDQQMLLELALIQLKKQSSNDVRTQPEPTTAESD